MKTTHKKLVGGLLVSILIGTIGVAFATGQTDTTNSDTIPQLRFGGKNGMTEFGPFASDLTDEQQTELKELIGTPLRSKYNVSRNTNSNPRKT